MILFDDTFHNYFQPAVVLLQDGLIDADAVVVATTRVETMLGERMPRRPLSEKLTAWIVTGPIGGVQRLAEGVTVLAGALGGRSVALAWFAGTVWPVAADRSAWCLDLTGLEGWTVRVAEPPRLPERVAHRQVDRRMLVDLRLRVASELAQQPVAHAGTGAQEEDGDSVQGQPQAPAQDGVHGPGVSEEVGQAREEEVDDQVHGGMHAFDAYREAQARWLEQDHGSAARRRQFRRGSVG